MAETDDRARRLGEWLGITIPTPSAPREPEQDPTKPPDIGRLVEAIAAAVDTGRRCEVRRLVRTATEFGLGQALEAELRLVGIDSLAAFEEEY